MKKDKKRMIMMLVMATVTVVAATTACGKAKNNETETVAATSAAETETTEEATEVKETEEILEETEEETVEAQDVVSDAGTLNESGKFTAVSGKYELSIPKGWIADEGNDAEYVTFFAPNDQDFLEVVYLTGNAVESERESLPVSLEEYKKLVDREDGSLEFVTYQVEKTDDKGSETFQYSTKEMVDGAVEYNTYAGYYNADSQEYIRVTGRVASGDDASIKAVDTALASFTTLK